MDAPGRRVRTGLFEIDLGSAEIQREGRRLPLQEQPFRVLAMLLERPGEVITREELQARLWPTDTFVGFDESINTAIRKLRVVFGDSADNPRFIETIPRRGYRFIAPVQDAIAVRLASDQHRFYAALCAFALGLQHFDEARRAIRDAHARKLDDYSLHDDLYALAFLDADSAGMAEQQRWLAGNPEYESFGLTLASDTEAYVGHLSKARALARRAVESAKRADDKENAAIMADECGRARSRLWQSHRSSAGRHRL